MAKYDVTRSCGHTETVELFGPGRDRKWRLENVEEQKLCADCYRDELARQNAEAAKEAEEMGLPALTGTEKQAAWAETIRKDTINTLERLGEKYGKTPHTVEVIDHLLATRTNASWWIDNRDMVNSRYRLGEVLQTALVEFEALRKESTPVAQEAKAEATVRPESPVTETVAEIRPTETAIEISFPEG